ncbi:MAG TPA: type I-D CRISPR-associated protein Cas7/Csc2 [Desulfobulbaceae bacterium]|nr:type I-D CRISPR-associated protein Cas7/Csc2 [Desulfobulbaceae bacterium]
MRLLEQPEILSTGCYLQLPLKLTLLDDAIIRSNEPEEVLTFRYKELGNRFIIPWRKIKGKLRRLVLEKQRGLNIEPECALKDDLCMKCPTCFLFGGTGETSKNKVSYNILSRVYGETFISETEVGDITPYTQNAVREQDLKTGQALMSILTVPRETVFIGVVTLKDPTPEMAAILVYNLNRMSRIGARSVEWGRIQVKIEGAYLSDREVLSGFLELKGRLDPEGREEGENEYQQKTLQDIESLKLPKVDVAYNTLNNQVKKIIESLEGISAKNND